MSNSENPFGLHTVTPYLVVENVAALIDFLKEAFDAKDDRGLAKIRDDGSVMHAELTIGDSVIMMGEPTGEFTAMPGTMYVYVDDCDARYERALALGATSVMPPADQPHGDRYGGVKDASGNLWFLVTHVGKGSS